uniref:Protein slit n=1 Tax=Cacopsylla melanoneura TaxID=428564 RepID=A0A8D8VD21_9HEMI
MNTNVGFLLILSCYTTLLFSHVSCNQDGELSPPTKRCDYATFHRLFAADCSSLSLTSVPQHVNPDIMVLDLHDNRLRILTESSFLHLPNLKILYLYDNEIRAIDSHTFDPLSKLETLDLKGNLLKSLNFVYPKSLVRLYVGNNPIMPDQLNLHTAHSLQFLSLQKSAYTQVPDIGALPNLVELDLTRNAITNLSSLQLAPFCRLQMLLLDDDVFPDKEMFCDCERLKSYTMAKNIVVKPGLECKPDESQTPESCPPPVIPDETLSRFSSCQSEWDSRQFPHWAISSLLLVLFAACVAVGIVLWRRRRDATRRKKSTAAVDKESKTKEPEAKTEPALLA